MQVSNELKNKKEEILQIAASHGVKSIKVFGSVARGEKTKNSDIDIIIKFEEGRSLFDLIDLKDSLEELLERKVDVVTENSIHWYLKDKIEAEAIEL